ncbi:methyltransferase domain-containing protein [Ditylenchus destructor]|nr:methyltransferase domain-containing protein [Ditylenchus destructor]
MANDWKPDLYCSFEAERTRPSEELLRRVTSIVTNPKFITDLGCGPGNSTELLAKAFSNASILGTDTSEAMLEKARKRLPACTFQQSDIGAWKPDRLQDIIFANASLQWVRNHDVTFPQLFDYVAENGVLAVQMPDNYDEHTHRILREMAKLDQWKEKLSKSHEENEVLMSPTQYYDLLSAKGAQVDIWRTTYFHVMSSVDSIVDWFRSTRLRPYLNPLNDSEQHVFLQQYSNELKQHYKSRADGRVLLPFPRLFMMANDWKPDLYCSFEAERTRPSEELLRRVTSIVTNPKLVTDLGCGPGNSTELLAKAFSNASILGTDTSEAMLEKARKRLPACTFQQSDIGAWKPDRLQDIIFANASLQWVRNHDVTFPQLFDYVAENGVLAVQMPDNHDEHTQRIIREMANLDQWKEKLSKCYEEYEVLMSPTQYYDLLSAKGAQVDIWRTTYFHVMSSVDSIVDWFRSARLRPYLNSLNDSEQHVFLQQYSNELAQHYKPRADGRVLLPVPRLFMVARKVIQ